MMTVNLLPWRRRQREQAKQHWIVLLGSASLLVCCLIAGLNQHLSTLILQAQQQILNQQAQRQLDEQAMAQLKQLRERQHWLQAMQSNPLQWLHWFESLSTLIPPGMYLTHFHQQGKWITLRGKGTSNAAIAQCLLQLQNHPQVSHPRLSEIKSQRRSTNSFQLNLQLAWLT